ncbi:MAG: hypothetical protein SOI46_01430 [Eggerthellaceae bacterium]|jgi:hypothetical protein
MRGCRRATTGSFGIRACEGTKLPRAGLGGRTAPTAEDKVERAEEEAGVLNRSDITRYAVDMYRS